ncbi:hypothetical protein AB1Y20_002328 [Prymnesium parvum]|uniref:Uncharacterized protein n=1 Tax=Prymnesium parvum TaxID=97485 RepID=A0AB34J8S9_PRYPA
MSATPAHLNAAAKAPGTISGRTTDIHISHGGELAPATSEAVVGASPNVETGKLTQKTPQRAPQAKWFEGIVRSIQGRGADKGYDGGSSVQPPPPSYPPSEGEGEEDSAVAASDAAAASPPLGSPEAANFHGEDEGKLMEQK